MKSLKKLLAESYTSRPAIRYNFTKGNEAFYVSVWSDSYRSEGWKLPRDYQAGEILRNYLNSSSSKIKFLQMVNSLRKIGYSVNKEGIDHTEFYDPKYDKVKENLLMDPNKAELNEEDEKCFKCDHLESDHYMDGNEKCKKCNCLGFE